MQYLVSYEVLACTVTLDNSLDKILWDISIVGKQLFGVLWQAIASVTKRRIIIERSNTWVKTNTLYDIRCIEPFHLSVSIQFIEIANTQGEVSISK